MSNLIYEQYRALWDLGARTIRDAGGRTIEPAADFVVPLTWLRAVTQAAAVASRFAEIVPDEADREEFLVGEHGRQIALLKRHPELAPLHKVLDHLFDGDLRGAYVVR